MVVIHLVTNLLFFLVVIYFFYEVINTLSKNTIFLESLYKWTFSTFSLTTPKNQLTVLQIQIASGLLFSFIITQSKTIQSLSSIIQFISPVELVKNLLEKTKKKLLKSKFVVIPFCGIVSRVFKDAGDGAVEIKLSVWDFLRNVLLELFVMVFNYFVMLIIFIYLLGKGHG